MSLCSQVKEPGPVPEISAAATWAQPGTLTTQGLGAGIRFSQSLHPCVGGGGKGRTRAETANDEERAEADHDGKWKNQALSTN